MVVEGPGAIVEEGLGLDAVDIWTSVVIIEVAGLLVWAGVCAAVVV